MNSSQSIANYMFDVSVEFLKLADEGLDLNEPSLVQDEVSAETSARLRRLAATLNKCLLQFFNSPDCGKLRLECVGNFPKSATKT